MEHSHIIQSRSCDKKTNIFWAMIIDQKSKVLDVLESRSVLINQKNPYTANQTQWLTKTLADIFAFEESW